MNLWWELSADSKKVVGVMVCGLCVYDANVIEVLEVVRLVEINRRHGLTGKKHTK